MSHVIVFRDGNFIERGTEFTGFSACSEMCALSIFRLAGLRDIPDKIKFREEVSSHMHETCFASAESENFHLLYYSKYLILSGERYEHCATLLR